MAAFLHPAMPLHVSPSAQQLVPGPRPLIRLPSCQPRTARGAPLLCRSAVQEVPVAESNNGNGTHAAVPVVEAAPAASHLLCAPEDFKLPPGKLSKVDRMGKSSAADVFRCVGCTEAACQVGDRQCLALRLRHVSLQHHDLSAPLQSSSGCAATPWRMTMDGYLREILTARVYDVAVSGTLLPQASCSQ